MCRLTAYVGARTPLDPLLFGGTHPLLRQSWAPRELLSGSVNADGWGIVWWRDGVARRLARPEPAWFDPDLRGVLASVEAPVAIAALRNATPGLPVASAAVPPLALDRWAFVLNGFIPDFRQRHMRALRRLLPDRLYAELRGVSDAETLFLLAIAEVDAGAEPAAALDRVALRVFDRVRSEGGGETQLTMLLSDGTSVAVCHRSDVARTNSLYASVGSSVTPDGALLASEPLTEADEWLPVPPHSTGILTADGWSHRDDER